MFQTAAESSHIYMLLKLSVLLNLVFNQSKVTLGYSKDPFYSSNPLFVQMQWANIL